MSKAQNVSPRATFQTISCSREVTWEMDHGLGKNFLSQWHISENQEQESFILHCSPVSYLAEYHLLQRKTKHLSTLKVRILLVQQNLNDIYLTRNYKLYLLNMKHYKEKSFFKYKTDSREVYMHEAKNHRTSVKSHQCLLLTCCCLRTRSVWDKVSVSALRTRGFVFTSPAEVQKCTR